MPQRLDFVRPEPLPPIYPQWEYAADSELQGIYTTYKRAFQVPWVGVVTLAYAHYRHFFAAWWQAMEPVVGRQSYVDSAWSLRAAVEEKVHALSPPPLGAELRELGYSVLELKQICDMIEVITHGNFIQIPAVIAARLLLEGGRLDVAAELGEPAAAHRPVSGTPFVLMEPHHALDDLKTLYDEVKTTLGLPFVNTDYRCFSRWPSYFAAAWRSLRPHIGTPEHDALVRQAHEDMVSAAARVPNPLALTGERLSAAAAKDASLDELRNMTRLFSWLIPGLVVNVAFFRAQLADIDG